MNYRQVLKFHFFNFETCFLNFRSNSQCNGPLPPPPGSGNSLNDGFGSGNESIINNLTNNSRQKSRSVDRIPRLPEHNISKTAHSTGTGRQRATWRVPNGTRRSSEYPSSRFYSRGGGGTGGNKDAVPDLNNKSSPRTKSDGEIDVSV
jgi:hypothetical protein